MWLVLEISLWLLGVILFLIFSPVSVSDYLKFLKL